jgi:hypothetical protein
LIIKIKKRVDGNIRKSETKADVKEIIINEDIMHPNSESFSVCFRGDDVSGIVEMTSEEIEKFYYTIQNRMHMIKDINKIK